jgi:hypothetical protein
MKSAFILALIVILPVILTGQTIYSETDHAFNPVLSVINPSLQQNRSWRIHEIRDFFDYDYTGTLTDNSKTEFFYNSTNPSVMDSILFYAPEGDDFTLANTLIYNYDSASGNLIRTDQRRPDVETSFILSKTFYYYDNQNRISNTQRHSLAIDGFRLSSSTEYLYDNNRLAQSLVTVYSQNPPDTTYHRTINQHDADGRIINVVRSRSDDSLSWAITAMGDLTYASDDNTTGQDYIDYVSHQSVLDFLNDTGYFGKLASDLSYYDFIDNIWEYMFQNTYQYNADGFLTEILGQVDMGGVWQNNTKTIYSFDANDNCTELNTYLWLNSIQAWSTPTVKKIYTWEQTTANDDEVLPITDFRISVYPNPFKNGVSVSFKSKSNTVIEAAVYNVKGQLVKSLGKSKTASLTWDGKDKNGVLVGNGIYFIKASQNGKTVTNKIIRIK